MEPTYVVVREIITRSSSGCLYWSKDDNNIRDMRFLNRISLKKSKAATHSLKDQSSVKNALVTNCKNRRKYGCKRSPMNHK